MKVAEERRDKLDGLDDALIVSFVVILKAVKKRGEVAGILAQVFIVVTQKSPSKTTVVISMTLKIRNNIQSSVVLLTVS